MLQCFNWNDLPTGFYDINYLLGWVQKGKLRLLHSRRSFKVNALAVVLLQKDEF